MKLDDLYKRIQNEKPQIYLSGKTCVGKSTFASKLQDNLGYEIIDLDKIVFDSIIRPQGLSDEKTVFVEVYKNSEKRNLIDPFVAAVKQLIVAKAVQNQPIVLMAQLQMLIRSWKSSMIVRISFSLIFTPKTSVDINATSQVVLYFQIKILVQGFQNDSGNLSTTRTLRDFVEIES